VARDKQPAEGPNEQDNPDQDANLAEILFVIFSQKLIDIHLAGLLG